MDRGSFFEESETFRNKRGEAYRKLFVKYFVYNQDKGDCILLLFYFSSILLVKNTSFLNFTRINTL